MYCSLVRLLLEYCTVVWSGTSRKNIKNIEKIQRSMTRYVFNYAEVDYKDRLLMTNILPLTMRREYTDIVLLWKCLYGNYDVDVNDFVSCFSDGGCCTRNSLDLDFLWYHPCVVQTALNVASSIEYFLCGILYHLMYVILLITLFLYPV